MENYSGFSGWTLKCNHMCPYKKKKNRNLTHRRREGKQWDQTSKDGSFVSTSQGMLEEARNWFCLGSLEIVWPCWHFDCSQVKLILNFLPLELKVIVHIIHLYIYILWYKCNKSNVKVLITIVNLEINASKYRFTKINFRSY